MFVHSQLNSLIPKRSSVCCQNKEEFLPGKDYITSLLMTEKGWKREDFCPSCWEIKENSTAIQGLIWKGKIPQKRKKLLSQDERALQLLKEIHLKETEEDGPLKFVLALYLERKKELIKRTTYKNQICYEAEASGETFSIDRIEMSITEFDLTVAKLMKRLDG